MGKFSKYNLRPWVENDLEDMDVIYHIYEEESPELKKKIEMIVSNALEFKDSNSDAYFKLMRHAKIINEYREMLMK